MAIQQSINQLLGTGAIALGLYANSEQGRNADKLARFRKDYDPNTMSTSTGRLAEDIRYAMEEELDMSAEESGAHAEGLYKQELAEIQEAIRLEKDPMKKQKLAEDYAQLYNNLTMVQEDAQAFYSGREKAVQAGNQKLASDMKTQDFIQGILNSKEYEAMGARKQKKLKRKLKTLKAGEEEDNG